MLTSLDQIQTADDLVNSVSRQTTLFTGIAQLIAGLKQVAVRKLGPSVYTGDTRNKIDKAFGGFGEGENMRVFEGAMATDPKNKDNQPKAIVAKVESDLKEALGSEILGRPGVSKALSETFDMANDERIEQALKDNVDGARHEPVATGDKSADKANAERGHGKVGGVQPTEGRTQSPPGKVGH